MILAFVGLVYHIEPPFATNASPLKGPFAQMGLAEIFDFCLGDCLA